MIKKTLIAAAAIFSVATFASIPAEAHPHYGPGFSFGFGGFGPGYYDSYPPGYYDSGYYYHHRRHIRFRHHHRHHHHRHHFYYY